MKRTFFIAFIILFASICLRPDVVKKTVSEVSFKKYGTFNTERFEVFTEMLNRTNSFDTFKGKGFLSKLAAKMFFKSGEYSRITDLEESKIYNIDHKKKRVTVQDIEKMKMPDESGDGKEEKGTDDAGDDPGVKITKNELKVIRTGKGKTINGFSTEEYTVSWVVEWEKESEGLKGSNVLNSVVWITPFTRTIIAAQKVENEFFNNYMKKLGIVQDRMSEEVLGGAWMKIFASLSKSETRQNSEDAVKFAKEIGKIKGYPVLVEGEYFMSTEGGEEESGGSKSPLKKLFGKKKNVEDDTAPDFTFRTELRGLTIDKHDPETYRYPEEYKVK